MLWDKAVVYRAKEGNAVFTVYPYDTEEGVRWGWQCTDGYHQHVSARVGFESPEGAQQSAHVWRDAIRATRELKSGK